MALTFSDYKKRFSGDVFFYGNASHALYDTLIWLQKNKPKARPNIVLPVYISAKIYRYVLAAGYQPKFYDISLSCQINVNQTKSLIDSQTQAVLCIHYFGIPASLEELKLCTTVNSIFLIEYCIHTLNSRWNGRELGSTGDCAIFSSRKMMQLPAGGFMALNKKLWHFTPRHSGQVKSVYTTCKLVRKRAKYTYYYLTRGRDPLDLARTPDRGYINFYETHEVRVKNMSWFNQVYLNFVNLDKIADIRRANYEYLYNGIKSLTFLKPMPVSDGELTIIYKAGNRYHLRRGITPCSLPVLVPVGTREMLLEALYKTGTGCSAGWPESPFGYREFNQATELSERLIELPIYHGVNKYQLDRIISCLHDCEKAEEKELFKLTQKRRKSEVA